MKIIALLFFSACCIWADNTTVLLQSPFGAGPFPTDALTVSDSAQKTGLRVNIPAVPNCSSPFGSDCGAALLNQLDGFSVNPMLVVCFSAPIDPATLPAGVQIWSLSHFGSAIGISQVLYDAASGCMYAKPAKVLDQQSHYLLTVSDAILDTAHAPVQASADFKVCLNGGSTYCTTLSQALNLISILLHLDNHLVAGSVFTTMSATDWEEKAHTVVNSPSTGVTLLPGSAIYPLSTISKITYVPDDTTSTPPVQDVPVSALSGIEKIAFGAYLSPNFLNVSGPLAGSITPTPTGGAIAPPSFVAPVSFHVFLPPAAKMPHGGFPVVVYGHGLSDNQFGAPTYIASTLAAKGFATLAIEIPGHGYGPGSHVDLSLTDNTTATVPTPGRGIQLAPGAPIGSTDGCILPGPLAIRDCGRQTAVDLFALVKTIQSSGGLGLGIDTTRIYYVGQSFGSIYGTIFHAVEPSVRAAVLNTIGGTTVATSQLSPIARQLALAYIYGYNPSLFDVPPDAPEDYFHDAFNDNYVYRDLPPATGVPGAAQLQIAFEVADWLDMNGDPLAYAPHLKTSPLASVPAKSTLVQFAFGDLEMPNPTNSAFIRAGNLQSSSWYYHFEVAASLQPGLLGIMQPGVPYPIMPHRYLSNPTIFLDPAEKSVALAAQQQVAAYFATDGANNPNPNPFLSGVFNGQKLFEASPKLPEQLNFLQIPK